MNMARTSRTSILTALILLVSCVDPYDAPYNDLEIDFLVVDGFLDSGAKTATIRLSKAMPLDTATTDNPVRNAIVEIEDEVGMVIPVPETASGLYTVSSPKIQTGKKFRLRVNTSSKKYISDEVELRAAPSLDSVGWSPSERGVTVYVDSHDVAGSTRYYQWYYTETWEYNAGLFSMFLYDKKTGAVIPRGLNDFTYICYSQASSTKVLVTSTTTNTLDIVNDFPLTFIPAGSLKTSRMYSIEVQQRALDEQAYTYWLNLQKTTENLGGLFDPLPNEVTGNMHNVTDPSERVLGYFSGGEIQRKRLFIKHDELPPYLTGVDRGLCEQTEIPVEKLRNYIGFDLYLVESRGTPVPYAYTTSPGACVDCRMGGGVLQAPAFWPPR